MKFGETRDKWLGTVTDDLMSTLMHVEINPVEVCNRRCSFCPRSDPSRYPNQNKHINSSTVHNLCQGLKDIEYKNVIEICGFGEPLLHEDFLNLVKIINSYNIDFSNFNIITNGDFLSSDIIKSLVEHGIDNIIINLYDGEHQAAEFEALFKLLRIDNYILRDSYNPNSLILNNRGGYVDVGGNIHSDECYLPFYKMVIDWNGDMLLCGQDWGRESKLGNNVNIHDIRELWLGKGITKFRNQLLQSKRNITPCSKCNVPGKVRGERCFAKFKTSLDIDHAPTVD
jgi:radical SAM protein with 4Fe4S-binding SPASM domain